MLQRKINIKEVNFRFNEDDAETVHHYIAANGTMPSYFRLNGPFIYEEVYQLLKGAKGAIHDWEFEEDGGRSSAFRISMGSKTKLQEVFFKLRRSYNVDETQYIFHKDQEKYRNPLSGWMVCPEVDIMYSVYKGRPTDLIEKLRKIRLPENHEHNMIHLICQDPVDNILYTKEYPLLKNNFDYDLELHYGEGFNTYHDTNLKRINESKKGIILMHGMPGTGKSYYIRRLICDLAKRKKKILYLPNNMVDLIGTPAFNNFLLEFASNVDENGQKNKGVLIIIEDAERVLLKRETNPYGGDGIASILNSTDGILNDFMNIQILATFNCDVSRIDEAIMRKQRAISIREFKKLSIKDAQKLANHLGLDYKVKTEMSLADIYSIHQEREDNVLLKTAKENKIGFKQN